MKTVMIKMVLGRATLGHPAAKPGWPTKGAWDRYNLAIDNVPAEMTMQEVLIKKETSGACFATLTSLEAHGFRMDWDDLKTNRIIK